MGLDIRWPIGFMFSLIGALLTLSGIFTASDTEMYKRSLGINVNLWWGLVLLVFGAWMLLMAWRAQSAASQAQEKPAETKEPAGKR
jgi:protein-S-isoprenylcysteine O-methyltransferase Ste14